MALPKISMRPRTTSLSSSMPISVSTIYQVYPNRLPSAPDIPQRINPLSPTPPQKRTVMLETINPHWHNEQRTNRMKQREHYRYHNAWSKYYYGSIADKEAHRSYIRSVLKQQMTDKWSTDRRRFADRIRESEQAVNYDQTCRSEDREKYVDKHRFLTSYRDDNKRLMETAWAASRQRTMAVNEYDREQLKYNPINWSATLK